jgi:hypothetical protein
MLDGSGLGGGEVHHISSVPVSISDDYGDTLEFGVSSLYEGNVREIVKRVKSDVLDVSQFDLNNLWDSCN